MKISFKTIASKELYVLLQLVSVNLALVLSVPLFIPIFFKAPSVRNSFYFTFIKSVAINKDLSQPL